MVNGQFVVRAISLEVHFHGTDNVTFNLIHNGRFLGHFHRHANPFIFVRRQCVYVFFLFVFLHHRIYANHILNASYDDNDGDENSLI